MCLWLMSDSRLGVLAKSLSTYSDAVHMVIGLGLLVLTLPLSVCAKLSKRLAGYGFNWIL
jgi:hypothetical protein